MSMSPPAIVLVHPRNPNNIGAAARAMSNFGFTELIVIAPHPPVWEETLKSAIGAENVIRNARLAETLAEAVSDCTVVIGTVDARRGAGLTPAGLRDRLSDRLSRTAMLFGSEKSGLTNKELSYCHHIVSIPTVEQCPSMNLGQAVAICCYELARQSEFSAKAVSDSGGEDLATVGEVEALLEASLLLLRSVDFISARNEERMTTEMRRSFLRFQLTQRELTLWRGALSRLKR